jgi:hypothetical protein
MKTYKTEDEAIAAAKESVDGFTDFDGMNCDDWLPDGEFCAGWDGESRRCDCGNRRVYWAIYRSDDGGFYAVAEAY